MAIVWQIQDLVSEGRKADYVALEIPVSIDGTPLGLSLGD